jgi:hypothetical protein
MKNPNREWTKRDEAVSAFFVRPSAFVAKAQQIQKLPATEIAPEENR